MLNIVDNNSTIKIENVDLRDKPYVTLDLSIANAILNFDPAKLVEIFNNNNWKSVETSTATIEITETLSTDPENYSHEYSVLIAEKIGFQIGDYIIGKSVIPPYNYVVKNTIKFLEEALFESTKVGFIENLYNKANESAYIRVNDAGTLVINVGSASSADIKTYLEYSGCLDQGISTIYVQGTNSTYELISVKELTQEYCNRGLLEKSNDLMDQLWAENYIKGANDWINNIYADRKFVSSSDISNSYILLKPGEDLLFPTEYTGNLSVKLYAPDSKETTLNSGSGNDSLYGGEKNDILDGGTGSDIMIGGKGDDTYYVDNSGDVVTEAANEGTDKVYSSISYTLGANIENLILTETSNINGAGNDLDNVIKGNDGNNTLIGNVGTDEIHGGKGDDIIFGDYAANELVDKYKANNLTDLDLINAEKATDVNDTLYGDQGNDFIVGGGGNDQLIDSAGSNDTYLFHKGDGQDTINDAGGADIIQFGSNVSKNNIALFMDGSDLVLSYGNNDTITIQNQDASNNQIETIKLADNTYLSNTDVNTLIQTMTSYATNNNISITNINDVRNNQDLMAMVANSWHS